MVSLVGRRGRRNDAGARRILVVDGEATRGGSPIATLAQLRLPVDVVRTIGDAQEQLDRHRRRYFAAVLDVDVDGATGKLVKTLLEPIHACCPLAMLGDANRSTAAQLRADGIVRSVTRRVPPDAFVSIVRETISDTLRYRARLQSSAVQSASPSVPDPRGPVSRRAA